jgi:glycosidase
VHQGFGPDDAIYLVMPDRFVNGDASNDSVAGYFDEMQHIPTQQRKGGDIQGLINKLDYIKDMGFTTIWSTPLTENNTFRSYHGYATTDHYKVDPRLGNNELYKAFVEEAHKRGLKIILDHVANHISDDHPWIKNLPTDDWINGT